MISLAVAGKLTVSGPSGSCSDCFSLVTHRASDMFSFIQCLSASLFWYYRTKNGHFGLVECGDFSDQLKR